MGEDDAVDVRGYHGCGEGRKDEDGDAGVDVL